jgi:tRNA-dihydrouridine synthase
MYGGTANWDEIAAVVQALDIPVVGNGDVWTGADARRMRDHTGCAGVMIARGSHGAPWIFAAARAALDGRPLPSEPTVHERFEVMLEHTRDAIAFERDETRALLELRKHLGWYTKGLPSGKALRQELFAVRTLHDVAFASPGDDGLAALAADDVPAADDMAEATPAVALA